VSPRGDTGCTLPRKETGVKRETGSIVALLSRGLQVGGTATARKRVDASWRHGGGRVGTWEVS